MSDKCPICKEVIDLNDLKSVEVKVLPKMKKGSAMKFRLMTNDPNTGEVTPAYSADEDEKLQYSKYSEMSEDEMGALVEKEIKQVTDLKEEYSEMPNNRGWMEAIEYALDFLMSKKKKVFSEDKMGKHLFGFKGRQVKAAAKVETREKVKLRKKSSGQEAGGGELSEVTGGQNGAGSGGSGGRKKKNKKKTAFNEDGSKGRKKSRSYSYEGPTEVYDFRYFYQSVDSPQIFLHPICMKYLLEEENYPPPVLEVIHPLTLTSHRSSFHFLSIYSKF